jgi:hypothetical protein
MPKPCEVPKISLEPLRRGDPERAPTALFARSSIDHTLSQDQPTPQPNEPVGRVGLLAAK